MNINDINKNLIEFLEKRIKHVSSEEDNASYFKKNRYPLKDIPYSFRSDALMRVKTNLVEQNYEIALQNLVKAVSIGFKELKKYHIWISYITNPYNIKIIIRNNITCENEKLHDFDVNKLLTSNNKTNYTGFISNEKYSFFIDLSYLFYEELPTIDGIKDFIFKELLSDKY